MIRLVMASNDETSTPLRKANRENASLNVFSVAEDHLE